MFFYAQVLIKPNVLLAFSNVKPTATVLTKTSFVMVMIVGITQMKRTVVPSHYHLLKKNSGSLFNCQILYASTVYCINFQY